MIDRVLFNKRFNKGWRVGFYYGCKIFFFGTEFNKKRWIDVYQRDNASCQRDNVVPLIHPNPTSEITGQMVIIFLFLTFVFVFAGIVDGTINVLNFCNYLLLRKSWMGPTSPSMISSTFHSHPWFPQCGCYCIPRVEGNIFLHAHGRVRAIFF